MSTARAPRLRAAESASVRAARVLALNDGAEGAGRAEAGRLGGRGCAHRKGEDAHAPRAATAAAAAAQRVSKRRPQAHEARPRPASGARADGRGAVSIGAAAPAAESSAGLGAAGARRAKTPSRVKGPPSPAFLRAHGQLRDDEPAHEPAHPDSVGEHHRSPAAPAVACARDAVHRARSCSRADARMHGPVSSDPSVSRAQPGRLQGVLRRRGPLRAPTVRRRSTSATITAHERGGHDVISHVRAAGGSCASARVGVPR
jgi:hypothetical protein